MSCRLGGACWNGVSCDSGACTAAVVAAMTMMAAMMAAAKIVRRIAVFQRRAELCKAGDRVHICRSTPVRLYRMALKVIRHSKTERCDGTLKESVTCTGEA